MLGSSAMLKPNRKTKKKASKKVGRTPWTEADYKAKGIASLKLRLPVETVDLLTEDALRLGESRSEYVVEAVRERAERSKGGE